MKYALSSDEWTSNEAVESELQLETLKTPIDISFNQTMQYQYPDRK